MTLSEGIFPRFVYSLESHSMGHSWRMNYVDGFFLLWCLWTQMSLKPLIIAVGVWVNMVQGEKPSFFPWQQQGRCF